MMVSRDVGVQVFQLANGVILFGSVSNFIHPSCRQKFYERVTKSDELWIEGFDTIDRSNSNSVNKIHKANKVQSVTFSSVVDSFPKEELSEFPIFFK